MHLARRNPFLRGIPRLFEELALPASKRRFAGIQLASREFQDDLLHGIAILAHHDDVVIIRLCDDHDRTWMHDIFAAALAAVGKAHGVAPYLEKTALVHRLAVEGGFDDVG